MDEITVCGENVIKLEDEVKEEPVISVEETEWNTTIKEEPKEGEEEETEWSPTVMEDPVISEAHLVKEEDIFIDEECFSPYNYPPTPSSSGSTRPMQRMRKPASFKQDEVLDLIAKRFTDPQVPPAKFTYFGLHVAEELREMDPEMAIYAKRLIQEVLVHGYLEKLTSHSSIVLH